MAKGKYTPIADETTEVKVDKAPVKVDKAPVVVYPPENGPDDE